MTSWLIRFEQNPFFRIIIDFCTSSQEWRSEVQMLDISSNWETKRQSTGDRAYKDAIHYGVAT